MPDQPGSLLDNLTRLVGEGQAMDFVYLDLARLSKSVSHNILTDKLVKYAQDKRKVRLIGNWLNCWTRKTVVSSTKSSWSLVTCEVHNPPGVAIGTNTS